MSEDVKDALVAELERVVRRPLRGPEDAREIADAAAALAELLAARSRAAAVVRRAGRLGEGGSLAGFPLHEAAEQVLREAGEPLHARELGARIKAGGWRHPRSRDARPDQIVFQLAARLPRHGRFRRVAPNTFGLAAWDESRPPVKARRLSVGIFRGPGERIGRAIGGSEEPLRRAWRSS